MTTVTTIAAQIVVALVGAGGILAGAIFTYLGKRAEARGKELAAKAQADAAIAAATAKAQAEAREHSGTLQTSTASELWAQNQRLLDAYITDNRELRANQTLQAAQIREVERRAHESEIREKECDRRADALRQELEVMKEQMATFHRTVVDSVTAVVGDTDG